MFQIPPVITLDGTTLSSSSECSPIEESSQVTLLPSSAQQQQNGISSINCNISSNLSGTIDSFNDKPLNIHRAVGSVPSNDLSNVQMDMIISSLSNEQINSLLNESKDQVNLSSLSYLQTKQRRIDHRRNKSEPVIRASLEDLSLLNPILESSSTSTTSNESARSSNASFVNKRKSSKIKNLSPSINIKQIQEKSSITKKKKPWYNVSLLFIHFSE